MSTTGRTADGVAGAESAAAAVRESGFVRVVSRADGAGLAAAGVLARALDDAGVPFQVSVAQTDAVAATTFAAAADDSATVAFGFGADALTARDADADVDFATDASDLVREAASIVRALGESPFEPLVLAGLRAAGAVPTEDDGEFERRPGVGIPTEDIGDGLAHSALVHGEFSGDESRAGATLAELGLPAELDDSAHRRLSSVIAMMTTAGPAPERTADALQRVLQPHVHAACAYATIEGFGDVLDTLARTAPGLGVAAALGGLDRPVALGAWREATESVHAAVTECSAHVTSIDDDDSPSDDDNSVDHVVSATVSGTDPVAVARLLRDYVTAAPNVFVAGDDGAALATTDADARETLSSADADAIGGTERLAYASITVEDTDTDSTTDALDALQARVRGVL